ncbi:hypothetical protein [Desulfobacca acetoxidans]|uniref:Uncharacterized protein n=1 Tax=Desulfobacca acetoxidans (strain ATCC 700848 / DSM 11109 / ASRB2) TaxID=880072 RepID=F2NE16_DESAR|nr:hypothetical protein [Desulfobacca acetoxidans]AEB10584.1 hypothetical protein Desac_2771 [Desulfobacca acetoxidans DSM 11109]
MNLKKWLGGVLVLAVGLGFLLTEVSWAQSRGRGPGGGGRSGDCPYAATDQETGSGCQADQKRSRQSKGNKQRQRLRDGSCSNQPAKTPQQSAPAN